MLTDRIVQEDAEYNRKFTCFSQTGTDGLEFDKNN
jgi:hypothetical protein